MPIELDMLTTDHLRYFDKVAEELARFPTQEAFVYREIGYMWTHGYSFQFPNRPRQAVKMKLWKSRLDRDQLSIGIFNLDSLPISERLLHLEPSEDALIREHIKNELDTVNLGGIVLDGLSCQLSIGDQTLKWNVDQDESHDNRADGMRSGVVAEHRSGHRWAA